MNKPATIVSWLSDSVEVRSSGISGKGIFALKPIVKDERIAIFGGSIITAEEVFKMPAEFQIYPLQIEERFFIYMREPVEPEATDFINHSCKPNAGLNGQIFLVAMRNIDAGEEVAFDYCMSLSEFEDQRYSFTMLCSCGCVGCRGEVTQKDWQKPELQKRYRGYFSEYIEQKIKRLTGNALS